MARLEASGLAVTIGGRTLCRDLDLALDSGENWVVLGANGSGKTTLLHTLAGLRAPSAGCIRLDGKPLHHWNPRERACRIGLLLQDYEHWFPATVLESVLTNRYPRLGYWSLEGENDRTAAMNALDAVGLAALASRSLDTLSGGERRRAELAGLLAQDAPILLLDEPVNHLDLRHQGEVLGLIAARTQQPGHVNVFVLHDVNAALRCATHALLLFANGAHRAGAAAELLRPALLEQVYGCSFQELSAGQRRVYVPV